MYVTTMNATELAREYRRDYDDLIDYSIHLLDERLRRMIMKSNVFPMLFVKDWTSHYGNRYIVVYAIKKKSDLKRGHFGLHIKPVATFEGYMLDAFDNAEGNMPVFHSCDRMQPPIHLYQPHFFQRYRERFGLIPPYKDIYHQFAIRHIQKGSMMTGVESDDLSGYHGGESEVRNFWQDGVNLGTQHGMLINIRTFLSNDIVLTKRQQKHVNELIDINKDIISQYRDEFNEMFQADFTGGQIIFL